MNAKQALERMKKTGWPKTRTVEIPNLSLEEIHDLEADFRETYGPSVESDELIHQYVVNVVKKIYGEQEFG